MTFHNYLKGGPFNGAIFTYRASGGKQELLIADEEYFGLPDVLVAVYALEEADEMAGLYQVYQTSYAYVGERTVDSSLVTVWQEAPGSFEVKV